MKSKCYRCGVTQSLSPDKKTRVNPLCVPAGQECCSWLLDEWLCVTGNNCYDLYFHELRQVLGDFHERFSKSFKKENPSD